MDHDIINLETGSIDINSAFGSAIDASQATLQKGSLMLVKLPVETLHDIARACGDSVGPLLSTCKVSSSWSGPPICGDVESCGRARSARQSD